MIRLSFYFAAFLLIAVAGCGSDRPFYRVNGKIQFKKDDSFARFGTVEFRSETEPTITARGMIQKDGSFSLKTSGGTGTVAGWHTVVVLQPVANPHKGVVHNHGLVAAKKYVDHRTSDLRVEVHPDKDEDDYVLTIDNWVK